MQLSLSSGPSFERNMWRKSLLCFMAFHCVNSQFNGEFWWLNDKLAKLTGDKPPAPIIDESEDDVSNNGNFVFRESKSLSSNENNWIHNETEDSPKSIGIKTEIHFEDTSKFNWPSETKNQLNVVKQNFTELQNSVKKINITDGDIFNLVFPDDDRFVWKTKTETIGNNTMKDNSDKGLWTTSRAGVFDDIDIKSEPICSFTTKFKCLQNNGFMYSKFSLKSKRYPMDGEKICCILPLSPEKSTRIYFPGPSSSNKRNKRSSTNDATIVALNQRNFLLRQKFVPKSDKPLPISQKIVSTENDYVDPYLNIKNTRAHNSGYSTPSNSEDYAVELPKPGLVGLYSDHGLNSGWTIRDSKQTGSYGGYDDVDDYVEDEEDSIGYSTLDPRQAQRKKEKPFKLTTSTDYQADNPERHIVKVQSNPDFKVMEDFKLINIFRNKKNIKAGITTSVYDSVVANANDRLPIKVASVSDEYTDYGNYDDSVDSGQVYKDCGGAVRDPLADYEDGRQMGESENGTHPWLALVVLTQRRKSILCYATLVHPRAAVTSADCVYGMATGDVTVIAGAWNLDDEIAYTQQRLASMHFNPGYRAGELANTLAILYWKRPLKLNINVQPACLADPHVGDDCIFAGFGGYDQRVNERSRWQRATILTPKACSSRLSDKSLELPGEAFCAAVTSRGTVTGVGGPLMCNIEGRHSAVGVAIWRDHVVLMMPALEWTLRTLPQLLTL